ncbi:hypothetical protein AKO51_03745 [Brucella abortus]|nr:hypothetical protein AKO51_03745 [Brucella abortus]KPZ87867.1 hypothetical protein AKO50_03755 [Brucella abortus]OHY07569.1 hypothetical protein BFJ62_03735 [Brucella abortus]
MDGVSGSPQKIKTSVALTKQNCCFGFVGSLILYIFKDLLFCVGGMARLVFGRIKANRLVWPDSNFLQIVGLSRR